MKIHIAGPLLTLAIFFSFIELGSQYNTQVLKDGYLTLPGDKGIWYSITNDMVDVTTGTNLTKYGLLHGHVMVCILESESNKIVRALKRYNDRVKVSANGYQFWSDADTELYNLDFDHTLH
ncbi:uncharacterized protein LOC117172840 [Belonocnema kinseyi]|uniref:uncharacterized protein LOC117172840 n=1 Tax=Belonocnema kinseyi TaxID=2817044 RepID=UPI00143D5D5D|nr:uncharacterized protein LOC117172840 [Belonocnema kinseyi]XP_033216981.1 uncharacterized protein LOC117172840 [Belonocnema kinseyi]XP_033216982.1 uncharacterized protein LOC117172840 [Belonocnema kinseyi]